MKPQEMLTEIVQAGIEGKQVRFLYDSMGGE
jgi:hypothetical protein